MSSSAARKRRRAMCRKRGFAGRNSRPTLKPHRNSPPTDFAMPPSAADGPHPPCAVCSTEGAGAYRAILHGCCLRAAGHGFEDDDRIIFPVCRDCGPRMQQMIDDRGYFLFSSRVLANLRRILESEAEPR